MISSDKDRSHDSDQLSELRNELSNLPTPTRTESNFKSSTSKTIARQSTEEIQQANHKKLFQGQIQLQEAQNQGEITENEKKTQNSYYSSSKSSKTSYAMKISLMQASINAKDQLISELQEEINQLKKNQIEKDKSMIELQNSYELRFQTMSKQISQLENQVKEKESDIDHYKNVNQTLNFSQIQTVANPKTNIVDNKKLFDSKVQEEQEQDLHTLGANFWILQAEKEIQNKNPVYQNYHSIIEAQGSKKSQQRQTDKQFQIKQYIDSNRQTKNISNVQLPKISEPNQQDQSKQHYFEKVKYQTDLPYSKFNQSIVQIQQPTYNSRSESLQHFTKHQNQSQPHLNQDIDSDYYFAEQEINQIFSHQIPVKSSQLLDWASQPTNYIINHKRTTSQINVDFRDKPHIFSQNISNRNQYSKKQ